MTELASWAEIGRQIRQEIADLPKWERVARLKAQAQARAKAPHTLQRYVHLLDFYEGLNLTAKEIDNLPVGPSEVIVRMHSLDPTAAADALAALKEGRLTYRQILGRLQNIQPRRPTISKSKISGSLRAIIIETIGLDPTSSFEEIDRSSKTTSYLSDTHSIYKTGDLHIAFLSEADLLKKTKRGLRQFTRDVIVATGEFDFTFVMFLEQKSQSKFKYMTKHLLKSTKERIKPFYLLELDHTKV